MPDQAETSERVVIGIVVGSHGLQGTVKIDARTDFPERFEALKSCWVCRGESEAREVRIKRCKFVTRGILLTLEGVKTRDEADKLRGATIEVPISERWALPENSFYVSDLIGCTAVDESGGTIGTVEQVIRGMQDILSIQSARGEILVPFVDAWVGETDVNARRIVIKRATELFASEEIPPAVGESDH